MDDDGFECRKSLCAAPTLQSCETIRFGWKFVTKQTFGVLQTLLATLACGGGLETTDAPLACGKVNEICAAIGVCSLWPTLVASSGLDGGSQAFRPIPRAASLPRDERKRAGGPECRAWQWGVAPSPLAAAAATEVAARPLGQTPWILVAAWRLSAGRVRPDPIFSRRAEARAGVDASMAPARVLPSVSHDKSR